MNKSQKGMAGLESLLILVIVGILAFTGWYVYKARQNSNKNLNNAASIGQTVPATYSKQSTTLSSGSDNQSLQGDLSSINTSQSQASQDYSSSSSAVNDQQNEISVPTN